MLALNTVSRALPAAKVAAQSLPSSTAATATTSVAMRLASPSMARHSLGYSRIALHKCGKLLAIPKPVRNVTLKHLSRPSTARFHSGGPPAYRPQSQVPSERSSYAERSHSSSIESAFARVELEGNLNAAQTHKGRFNTLVNICPQQEVWIVERFGKYLETVGGGMHLYIPFIDSISYRFSMKEQALIIPSRSAITKDNVRIHCIGVLYYKIVDPYAAAYGCGDPVFSLSQLAQTSLRSVIGKLTLDETFHERNLVNSRVVETCNDAAKVWGITCLRHEIREIQPPENVLHAMEMQMEAERKKRVDILQSEGEQQSVINRAEAQKKELILQSEATKTHAVNVAEGEASSIIIQARAKSEAQQLEAEGIALALERIAKASGTEGGSNAVQFELANKYIEALSQMAKKNNTMIVPANVADMSSMLAQATSVIKNVQNSSL